MGTRQIQVADQTLVIHELDDVSDSTTGRALTGSWVWDSALVLSNWMATQGAVHFHFQDKSVLELGAGAGLPGLTAARLGASRVLLTDMGPLLPGLLRNVEANGLGDRVEVRELVWGSDESPSQISEFDLILMSDVFYNQEEMVGLAKTLKSVCGRGTTVWASTEVRPWTAECLSELVHEGFGLVELPSQRWRKWRRAWIVLPFSKSYHHMKITKELSSSTALSKVSLFSPWTYFRSFFNDSLLNQRYYLQVVIYFRFSTTLF